MKTYKGNSLFFLKLKMALTLMVMVPLFASCGMHYNIKGSVVDARTGEPVEGAVVAINWIRYKLAPPGYPTPKERYGTTEDVTDSQGIFTIPYYPIGTHFMGIYKKGYVCWSSDTVFNPQGKDEDEMFVRRWKKLKNGMMVELEPKSNDFPELKHASFVQTVGIKVKWPTPMFHEATTEERKTYRNQIKSRMRKNKK
ncbi:hypothetical protein DSCA_56780 [Desulfosarcina alkanivorans]|uniref:Lipoprotein n=1 Tax=Desulfosarcina alkanivorans TaxID=571177 RepID=A0A5K7YSY5_9BACT|nr:carboxypeptidase-like regulatory domain-containing protein [Desulfosarcina alkanivorans]BBO71748.1 hypothetical protein DSCA_56780 [Desulfosarcina alkanivorans]